MGFTEKIINVFNPYAARKRAVVKKEIERMDAESEVLKAKLRILGTLMEHPLFLKRMRNE